MTPRGIDIYSPNFEDCNARVPTRGAADTCMASKVDS